jgi:hypothetical protein
MKCPHCGGELTPGGAAIACGPTGSVTIPLPPYCPSVECQAERGERALQRMIDVGVIDP